MKCFVIFLNKGEFGNLARHLWGTVRAQSGQE